MLTGQTDLGTAIDALHEGRVFRFLTKPVSTEALAEVIDAAIAQHNLIVAEQRYLNTIKSHNESIDASDPNDDPLTYIWRAANGSFNGGVRTNQTTWERRWALAGPLHRVCVTVAGTPHRWSRNGPWS